MASLRAVVDFDGVPAIIVTVFSTDRSPVCDAPATIHVAAEELLLTGSCEATGDILYLSASGDEKTTAAQEAPEGHAVRLDRDGRVTQLTAIDARRLLDQNGELIATLRDGPRVRIGRSDVSELLG